MSTRGSTYWDDNDPMDWVGEKRACPFCTIDLTICGCPHADRVEADRMQHYEGMGNE